MRAVKDWGAWAESFGHGGLETGLNKMDKNTLKLQYIFDIPYFQLSKFILTLLFKKCHNLAPNMSFES